MDVALGALAIWIYTALIFWCGMRHERERDAWGRF